MDTARPARTVVVRQFPAGDSAAACEKQVVVAAAMTLLLLGVLWLKRPRARHLARPAGWGCAWLLYALHAAGALTVAIFIVPGLLVVAVSSARDG